MRLPKESQLSPEQKEVCFAPLDRSILVTGPPGSGKTVVAIHRARALKKRNEKVVVAMFNRVLKQFTLGDEKECVTFQSWLFKWWKQTTSLALPREQIPGQRYQPPDYNAAARLAMGKLQDRILQRGNWGHLILDEAQDFPREAHRLLWTVRSVVFAGREGNSAPQLTILADENQRLTDNNSTISEIRKVQQIAPEDHYELRRNYRNTREIAELASHFYVGLPTGQPDLPKRRGDRPVVVITRGQGDVVGRIERYARNHREQEIGVLVFYDWMRDALFRQLQMRLRESDVHVQTYSHKNHKDSVNLRFDAPGTVSVFCYKSAKGLEFDTVFLPMLESLKWDGGEDVIKMNLYVMCSRARERLFLMVEDKAGQSPIWKLLPEQKAGLWELEEQEGR